MSRPVLAIGPANYAGQAFEWANAVENHLDASAWSFTRGPVRRGGFAFPATVTIPAAAFHTSLARRIRSRRLFSGATHIALDGYQPYFRLFRRGVFGRDASWLSRQGYQMAFIAHGTDVRDPAAHQARDRWSYFNEGSLEWRDHLTDFTARNRRYARDLGYPLFVSTPDLLLDLPEATWLPVCTDISAWATDRPLLERRVPRVLHLPSRRVPPIKGTQYVDPVMHRLQDEGLIEYVSPVSVPHREMPQLVQSCDIVVDQLLGGFYGVAAIEAMAAGRTVIGRLAPDVAALMPEEPVLLDADPDTLESVVRQVLEDRNTAREIAVQNLAFVRRWHDGRASASALSDYLGLPPVTISD